MAERVFDAEKSATINRVQCTTAGGTQLTGTATGITKDRKRVKIFNNGPNTIYVGFTSDVTANTGFAIPAATGQEFRLLNGLDLYGITVTANQVAPADTGVWESA